MDTREAEFRMREERNERYDAMMEKIVEEYENAMVEERERLITRLANESDISRLEVRMAIDRVTI